MATAQTSSAQVHTLHHLRHLNTHLETEGCTTLQFTNSDTVVRGLSHMGPTQSICLSNGSVAHIVDPSEPDGFGCQSAGKMTIVNNMLALVEECKIEVVFVHVKDNKDIEIFEPAEDSDMPRYPHGLMGHENFLLTYAHEGPLPRQPQPQPDNTNHLLDDDEQGWIQLFYIECKDGKLVTVQLAALEEPLFRKGKKVKTSVYWKDDYVYFAMGLAKPKLVKIFRAPLVMESSKFECIWESTVPIMPDALILCPSGNHMNLIIQSIWCPAGHPEMFCRYLWVLREENNYKWNTDTAAVRADWTIINYDNGGPIISAVKDSGKIYVWKNRDVTSEPDLVFESESENYEFISAAISDQYIVAVNQYLRVYYAGLDHIMTVSPDDSLLALADGQNVRLIERATSNDIMTIDMGADVLALKFSWEHYWLLIETKSHVIVFDLESKIRLMELPNTFKAGVITWSDDGHAVVHKYDNSTSVIWSLNIDIDIDLAIAD